MRYVSPEYQQQLNELAELLCKPERFKPLGQLALFPTVEKPHTVEAWHDPFIDDLPHGNLFELPIKDEPEDLGA